MTAFIVFMQLATGIMLLLLYIVFGCLCYFNVAQQLNQRPFYPEVVPPSEVEDKKNESGLRLRNAKNGNSSSDEERYSSKETVAIDEIANDSQISNENLENQSQNEGASGIKSVSEYGSSDVVCVSNTESTEETVSMGDKYIENHFTAEEDSKNEEHDADKESNTEKSGSEESDGKAQESTISTSAGGSTTRDSNEADKTVIENVSDSKNSSENLDTAVNEKCSKENDENEQRSRELDALNVASSKFQSTHL